MDVRRSPIAGTWYPAQPAALSRALDRYMAAARARPPRGKIWGLVAPHAGLRYAGHVAAWAFACLRDLHPEVVAVVGPLHSPAPESLLTSAHDAYATPL